MEDDPFDTARETYRRQGVGLGHVGFGSSPVILVVDFQNIFTRGRRGCGTAAAERAGELLVAGRAAGVPVFHTYVAFGGGATPGVWGEKCPGLHDLLRGSHETSIDALVAPVDGETVIEKYAPSAFFGTGLAERLRAMGVDTVITCGTSTSGCVRASVVDGVSHGFRMVVPRECVADRSAPSEKAALFDINAKYGDVVSLQDVLNHLHAAKVETSA